MSAPRDATLHACSCLVSPRVRENVSGLKVVHEEGVGAATCFEMMEATLLIPSGHMSLPH